MYFYKNGLTATFNDKTSSSSMYAYSSGISRTITFSLSNISGKFCRINWRCLFSITNIRSAQVKCFSVSFILAPSSVPADFMVCPSEFLKIVSAVRLRHLFLLQTKRMFMKNLKTASNKPLPFACLLYRQQMLPLQKTSLYRVWLFLLFLYRVNYLLLPVFL